MSDYLTLDERARLEELRKQSGFVRDVLALVEHILSSRSFSRVKQRARDFLRYVVAKTLLGESDGLKETTVAIAVFDEKADFDTAVSSKVRTAASDLRDHLDSYARGEGRHDKIRIHIPLNTYIPVIEDLRTVIVVEPFVNWNPRKEQGHLCQMIAAELAYRLEVAGSRAVVNEPLAMSLVPPRYVLRGVVEPQDDTLRITLSLVSSEAERVVLSQAFEGHRDDLLKITRESSDALMAAMALDEDALEKATVRVRRSGAATRRSPPLDI